MRGPATLILAGILAASACGGGGSARRDADGDPLAGRDVADGWGEAGEVDDARQDNSPDPSPDAADASGGDGAGPDARPDATCECDRNEDCADRLGDPGACRRNVCDPDSCACVRLDAPEEDPCDDGNPCTVEDACHQGTCVGGANRCACRDDTDCLAGEDGNPCNGTLFCNPARTPPACEVDPSTVVVCDGEPPDLCSAFACDPATGACVAVAANEGAACDDREPCTIGDACAEGACTGATRRACDDRESCTTDACEDGKGCVYRPREGACDDGDPCTLDDACLGGVCVAGSRDRCDDGNPCTTDSCTAGVGCRHDPRPGQACQDGDACTVGDLCDGTACVPGRRVDPDDGNPCTTDACDPFLGVYNVAFTGPCDDGEPCTAGEACDADGICGGGAEACCDNAIDDDGDGFEDCQDSDCAGAAGCAP